MEEYIEQLSFKNALLFSIGLACMYYFFFYSVNNYKQVIEDANTKIATSNAEIRKVDLLIREKQELETELLKNEELVRNSKEFVPTGFLTETALEKLTIKARSYGLSIENIGTFSDWQTEDQLEIADLKIGLKGTYSQIMFFISDFTREKNFYGFKNLRLTPVRNSQQSDENQINIALDVLILKLVESDDESSLEKENI